MRMSSREISPLPSGTVPRLRSDEPVLFVVVRELGRWRQVGRRTDERIAFTAGVAREGVEHSGRKDSGPEGGGK